MSEIERLSRELDNCSLAYRARMLQIAADDLSRGLDDLTRILSERPLPVWRPIDCAPKDGTYVLLWWPTGNIHAPRGALHFAFWDGFHECWMADLGRITDPTHWQPLPTAPGVPTIVDDLANLCERALTESARVHPDFAADLRAALESVRGSR